MATPPVTFPCAPGLSLHPDAIPSDLADALVSRLNEILTAGRAGQLPNRCTYKPVTGAFVERKQSRELLQFGCYTHSNRVEVSADVAELGSEPLLVQCVDCLVRAGIFTEHTTPDCCTVNVYAEGCWLPPHVDSHYFGRPFATVSLLSAQDVEFAPTPCHAQPSPCESDGTDGHTTTNDDAGAGGDRAAPVPPGGAGAGDSAGDAAGSAAGESAGSPLRLTMPVQSALRLEGIAADTMTHAVCAATAPRISLTFRRFCHGGHTSAAAARAAAAAQQAAAAGETVSRKRQKKLAKKEAKQAAKEARRLAREAAARKAAAAAGGSAGGGGAGGGGAGAKSVPIPVVPSEWTGTLGSATTTREMDGGGQALPNRRAARGTDDGSAGGEAGAARLPSEANFEIEHVQRVYDSIAQQWSGTRYKPWPRVQAFLADPRYVPKGALVGDLGCGNGKNLPACGYPRPETSAEDGSGGGGAAAAGSADASAGVSAATAGSIGSHTLSSGVATDATSSAATAARLTGGVPGGRVGCAGMGLGCDFSAELAKIAAGPPPQGLGMAGQVAVADLMNIPYRNGCFDAVLCIAVLHHISTVGRRERVVAECMRVLTVGGHAMFYAWALEQEYPAVVDPTPEVKMETVTAAATAQGEMVDKNAASPRLVAKSGHRFAAQDVLVPFHRKVDNPRVDPTAATAADVVMAEAGSSSSSSSSSATSAGGARDADSSTCPGAPGVVAKHAVYDEGKKALVFQRYCHVYQEGEVRRLFEPLVQAGLVDVVDDYWDTGNWAVIVRKVKAW